MSDSIRITAKIRIERPVEVVRHQYRDIDHLIRNNVHPHMRYEWDPSASGTRRIRSTFRVLGVEQHDVAELEDAPDGTFVIRYVEGTNAGTVLVHRFVPLGADATEVEVSADSPATLARRLLGPLFVAGVRQVMRKTLVESKRDLEQGSFVAGKAAGNLEHALSFLSPPPSSGGGFVRPAATRGPAAKRAVLEAACLVAVADGRVEPGEIDAVARVAQLIGASDERAWVEERAAALAAVAVSPEIVVEATRIGQALVAEGVGFEGITAAVVVALVNEGMSLGELELLRELARVAGVPDGSLPAVVERAERELASTT